MGIIGDAFKKLFSVIWSAIQWLGKAFFTAIKWLGEQVGRFFQFLFDLLIAFFTVIYDLIAGLLYLLYKIGVLAVRFFQVILECGRLLWSFVMGLTRTMGQLVFNPIGSSTNNAYAKEIGYVMTHANNALQLSSVAYILLFLIWIGTAIAVVNMISSIRNL